MKNVPEPAFVQAALRSAAPVPPATQSFHAMLVPAMAEPATRSISAPAMNTIFFIVCLQDLGSHMSDAVFLGQPRRIVLAAPPTFLQLVFYSLQRVTTGRASCSSSAI